MQVCHTQCVHCQIAAQECAKPPLGRDEPDFRPSGVNSTCDPWVHHQTFRGCAVREAVSSPPRPPCSVPMLRTGQSTPQLRISRGSNGGGHGGYSRAAKLTTTAKGIVTAILFTRAHPCRRGKVPCGPRNARTLRWRGAHIADFRPDFARESPLRSRPHPAAPQITRCGAIL